MDLWESSLHFLCNRLVSGSAGNFLTSDVTGLAFKWGVKTKGKPSNIQVIFLLT